MTVASAYTGALRVGLWAIVGLSLLGAVLVGLLARDRPAAVGEPLITIRPDERKGTR